jgi:hypothetical protein
MKVYDLSCDYFITAWNSDDCKYNKYKKIIATLKNGKEIY